MHRRAQIRTVPSPFEHCGTYGNYNRMRLPTAPSPRADRTLTTRPHRPAFPVAIVTTEPRRLCTVPAERKARWLTSVGRAKDGLRKHKKMFKASDLRGFHGLRIRCLTAPIMKPLRHAAPLAFVGCHLRSTRETCSILVNCSKESSR